MVHLLVVDAGGDLAGGALAQRYMDQGGREPSRFAALGQQPGKLVMDAGQPYSERTPDHGRVYVRGHRRPDILYLALVQRRR